MPIQAKDPNFPNVSIVYLSKTGLQAPPGDRIAKYVSEVHIIINNLFKEYWKSV